MAAHFSKLLYRKLRRYRADFSKICIVSDCLNLTQTSVLEQRIKSIYTSCLLTKPTAISIMRYTNLDIHGSH